MQNKVYVLNIQIIIFALHKSVFSTNNFFSFFLILHQITEIRSFPLLTPPKIRKICSLKERRKDLVWSDYVYKYVKQSGTQFVINVKKTTNKKDEIKWNQFIYCVTSNTIYNIIHIIYIMIYIKQERIRLIQYPW